MALRTGAIGDRDNRGHGARRVGGISRVGGIRRIGGIRRVGRVGGISGIRRVRAAVAVPIGVAAAAAIAIGRVGAIAAIRGIGAIIAAVAAAADQRQAAQRGRAGRTQATKATKACHQRGRQHRGLRIVGRIDRQYRDLREVKIVIGRPFAEAVAVDVLRQHQVAVAGDELHFGQLPAGRQEQLVLRRTLGAEEPLDRDDLSIDQHDLKCLALAGVGQHVAAFEVQRDIFALTDDDVRVSALTGHLATLQSARIIADDEFNRRHNLCSASLRAHQGTRRF